MKYGRNVVKDKRTKEVKGSKKLGTRKIDVAVVFETKKYVKEDFVHFYHITK